MKRFFTIFLTSLLVLSLAACGGEGSKVDAAWKDIFGAADNQIVLKLRRRKVHKKSAAHEGS